MIRHDVENQSQAAFPKFVLEDSEVRLRAKFGIETRWIDHVVAMRASPPGAQNGRAVYMSDPEVRKIVDDFGGVLKRKIFIELQSVG